jgi:hypothetical protein
MDANEIVVHRELCHGMSVVLDLFAKCICQPGKAARAQRPRWIDQWPTRIRAETLQIDENDLWICAQARERNLILLTTDCNMVDRISAADPSIRFQLVPARC